MIPTSLYHAARDERRHRAIRAGMADRAAATSYQDALSRLRLAQAAVDVRRDQLARAEDARDRAARAVAYLRGDADSY